MDKETRRALLSSANTTGGSQGSPKGFEDLPEPLPAEAEQTPVGAWRAPLAAAGTTAPEIAAQSPLKTFTDADAGEEHQADDWFIEPTLSEEEGKDDTGSLALKLALGLGIFLLAAIPRIYFLYFVADPSVVTPTWSNDTFHHWQVAYLSKEIGFSQGFLRLWDLKGMEYFWGTLHPVLLACLFGLTGSVDIMIPRLLSLVAGSVNVLLLFLIGRRFWGAHVGVGIALLSAFNPIVIFNDPSGMVEPFGLVFLLAGILAYPRRPFVAGLLWALASMARAEAWLFSMGLLAAAMLGKEESNRKIGLLLGWAIPIAFYMKYLLDWTGNAIFPVYWNFLANAAGRWVYRETLTSYQMAARPVLVAVFALSLLACLWVLLRRPPASQFYLLGFGSTAFITGFIGLTAYLTGYETWFWLTRFFVFPYMFLGALAAILFLKWIPQRLPLWGRFGLGWFAVSAMLVGVQAIWPAVLHDVSPGYTNQPSSSTLQEQAKVVREAYVDGRVLIPEDNPQFTYALVRFGGFRASDFLGQMYGPTYYYEGGDPFVHWETVGPQMWNWFATEDVTVLVTYPADPRFSRMMEEKPDRFELVGNIPQSPMVVYKVRR